MKSRRFLSRAVPVVGAALFYFSFAGGAQPAADWQEVRGDHFIVFYKANENFAKEVSRLAEIYYRQVAEDLGYARYSNFWTWEKRVKILIHSTKEEFLAATGEPEWSHGRASYDTKTIETYAACENFLDGLLPHEITHLIFRDFVGIERNAVPLWMDEGVAQWQEPGKRVIAKEVARALIQSGRAIRLDVLMKLDIRGSEDAELVKHFYMQSVTLIDFLVKSYGADAFTEFCRGLRDGKGVDEALRFAYTGRVENVSDLEEKWLAWVAS